MRFKITFILFICNLWLISSQLQIDQSRNIDQLVREVLLRNQCGSASNFNASPNFSAGVGSFTYSGDRSIFPFTSGVVLSTGLVREIPTSSQLNSNLPDSNTDTDLATILGITSTSLNDANYISFDFVPIVNEFRFNFFFASEEYDDNFPCSFADAFAFILTDTSNPSNPQNLAVIPGTTTPVSVTNIRPEIIHSTLGCNARNEEYFAGYNTHSATNNATNFNGRTVTINVEATGLTIGTTYNIKLVIADFQDTFFDSAVFLQGGSFNFGADLGPDRTIANGNFLCTGDMITLDPGISTALNYEWYKDDVLIPGAISQTLDVTETGDYESRVVLSASCTEESDIRIEFATSPSVNNSVTLNQCSISGESTRFNLEEINSIISNNPSNYNFSYYRSLADAQTEQNPITFATSYIPPPGVNSVFVRIKDTPDLCSSYSEVALNASVRSLSNPFTNMSSGLIFRNSQLLFESCDDFDRTTINDGVTSFDISTSISYIKSQVSGGVPLEDLEVTFYERLEDAQTETNAINPNNYRNNSAFTINNEQSLWIRVDNLRSSSCVALERDRLILKAILLPFTTRDITPLFECSYTLNKAVFDLTSKESEISNVISGNNGTISFENYYYIDNEQRISITNPNAFHNTTNPQIIYIPLGDDNSLCTNDISFEINTDRPNIDNSAKEISSCFNSLNVEFDLTSLENEIINEETDIRINYYDSTGNLIINPESFVGFVPPNNSSNQSYTVNVEVVDINNNCFSETFITLNANFYPTFQTPSPIEECEQDNNNIDEFDLTIRENEILNGLNRYNYTFEYFESFENAQNNTNPIRNPREYLFNENSGNNHSVKITSNSDNSCPVILPLILTVEQINPIGIESEYRICSRANGDLLGNLPIIQTNLSTDAYNIQWYLREISPLTQDFRATNNFYIPNRASKIFLKATHKVTRCRIIDSTTVIKSYIPEQIGIEYLNDFFEESNDIRITVNGKDAYKYSVDSLDFQDSPIFRDLQPGIHTARVMDNSSCLSDSIITQNFLIIDYPKFFTPNGDGINDTWTISELFSNESNDFIFSSGEGFLPEIYIFNRFGRLIKEIKSADDSWDGKLNNNPVPATDYWFKIIYKKNGIEKTFRSHFTLRR